MSLREDTIMIQAVGQDYQRLVSEGVPSLGWAGDPTLTVAFNWATESWEIWRHWKTDRQSLVLTTPDGSLDELYTSIIRLRDTDTLIYTFNEIAKRVDDHNAKITKAAEDAAEDVEAEAADRAEFGMRKSGML